MGAPGEYFKHLQEKWLPYYDETLRLERYEMTRAACLYDLEHIPLLLRRELYFHAFDQLCKAFQEYLQTLFIANATYPIAYNKWIKYQVVELLKNPQLYQKLPGILSVSNIEGKEIHHKVNLLGELLNDLTPNSTRG